MWIFSHSVLLNFWLATDVPTPVASAHKMPNMPNQWDFWSKCCYGHRTPQCSFFPVRPQDMICSRMAQNTTQNRATHLDWEPMNHRIHKFNCVFSGTGTTTLANFDFQITSAGDTTNLFLPLRFDAVRMLFSSPFFVCDACVVSFLVLVFFFRPLFFSFFLFLFFYTWLQVQLHINIDLIYFDQCNLHTMLCSVFTAGLAGCWLDLPVEICAAVCC